MIRRYLSRPFMTIHAVALLLLVSVVSAQQSDLVDLDTGAVAEVFSGAEHFSITARGTLDFEKYGLPQDLDLFDYEIYLLVHPMKADGWWSQNLATARHEWEAQAYLGGVKDDSAKDGERFEVMAVLASGRLADKYDKPRSFLKEAGVFRITEIKTVVARRP